MPETAPRRDEHLPWDMYLIFCKRRLNLGIDEFWNLTFAEFWPLYNNIMGIVEKPMTVNDVNELKKKWTSRNGDTRRVSGYVNRRNARA